MKVLPAVALILISASSCANVEITKDLSVEVNPVIAQKAQESGISFMSNTDQYQLIAGGRAVKSGGLASAMTTRQSQELSEPLWEGSNGAFVLSISDLTVNQQNAQRLVRGNSYNPIAYNPRTGGIGIITGQIIVSYTNSYDAKFIGTNFSIQLIDDFPDLKTAFYTVNTWQDIFLITNSLNQSGLVSSAEIEVMENFDVPN